MLAGGAEVAASGGAKAPFSLYLFCFWLMIWWAMGMRLGWWQCRQWWVAGDGVGVAAVVKGGKGWS